MSRVDLVIPTHNGGMLLRACLESLRRSRFTDITLFVFDDASRSPVEPGVRDIWPSARVLRVEENVGLAAGCNIAIDAGNSEFVVLLNDDTEVDPQWLEELVVSAERHPGAGSVASKIRLMSDRRKLHSAGDFYSVRGMPGNRGAWLDDLGQFDSEEQVFSACGGAALYRRTALNDVRLPSGQVFDERLFMYCEDVDLGWRLQRLGWPCIYNPNAVVYHHLSATGGGTLASYYVARNVWLLLARSIPPGVMTPFRQRVAAYHAGRFARMLVHIREPAARASLRGTAVGMALAVHSRGSAPVVNNSDTPRLQSLLSDGIPPFPGT